MAKFNNNAAVVVYWPGCMPTATTAAPQHQFAAKHQHQHQFAAKHQHQFAAKHQHQFAAKHNLTAGAGEVASQLGVTAATIATVATVAVAESTMAEVSATALAAAKPWTRAQS